MLFRSGRVFLSDDTALKLLDNALGDINKRVSEGRRVRGFASAPSESDEKPNMTNYEKAMQGAR